ncbi:MAG: acyl transferase [Bacteroidia bacterium]|nr:acyl transferase [Bacteroidia bacterium]
MQNELKFLADSIFDNSSDFESTALQLFNLQAVSVPVYKQFLQLRNVDVSTIKLLYQIPFLPIELFKYFDVINETAPQQNVQTFISSGTTGSKNSRHIVADANLYVQSFTKGFELVYGKPGQYCFLCLLPSYTQRGNSSLVYMMHYLMQKNKHRATGFYQNADKNFINTLLALQKSKQPTIIVGVTYALLDLVALMQKQKIRMDESITIIETGGMKGRRKEMIREEVHQHLKSVFAGNIHSEYGMTELLSQAYATANGLFKTPPWMKILIRDANDSSHYKSAGSMGAINVIDLANVYSCAFIETQDIGRMHTDGSFEVLGRMDASELRGCNLMFA